MPKKKAAASGTNRCFGDDILRHVLSYLPLDDALQTCVLNTRWRDHWRHTTDLSLIFDDLSFERFKQLVKLFIQLRGDSPLDKFVILAYPESDECTYTNTMLLIEYALKCQANELIVFSHHSYDTFVLGVPLISQHLNTIHLRLVYLESSSLDFSHCPVLEYLRIELCRINARRISSKSLKRMCITDQCSFPEDFHVRIFAPGLVSLQLDDFRGLTPSLEYMPFLVTAYVGLGILCPELKDRSSHAYPVEEGVILHGLSNAVNLELIADYRTEKFIYSLDLKCCPIFDKLKTLLLNEWFTAIDLVCILQHSSILEMLTLQLENTKKLISAMGAQETIELSFVCAYLKVVNIECRKVDDGIHKIVNILTTCGVLRQQISIKNPHANSNCFSFQKHEQPRWRTPLAPEMCAQS
ncbi:F-box/LRR-repeat protein At2g42720-like [Triticum aestivum]|uniref:F-box/LRR-repeat protein At2g42720-like n=1 Tax=Triticum aestivum TaxID=4565 RepID=UPI000844FFAA|nr:F-box/LRR-repeat protein At2g42720-like [Triticum aestivum]